MDGGLRLDTHIHIALPRQHISYLSGVLILPLEYQILRKKMKYNLRSSILAAFDNIPNHTD